VKKYAEKHEFLRFEYGIKKRRTTLPPATGGKAEVDEHPLIFPTALRHVAPYDQGRAQRHNLQIRVPVDDFHTQVFRVNFVPSDGERSPADAPVPFRYTPLKTGPRDYKMNMVSAQDSMAWETQGHRTDRSKEHLGVGDEGVIELRTLLREQIERVQQGLEPMGTIRDPANNELIDLGVFNERIGLYAPSARRQSPPASGRDADESPGAGRQGE
jgi:5,5'-dehydrodivanillate O-demethylase